MMPLIVIGFLGGVLTIVSPCILPVAPFVFARADRPFLTSRLPLLIGLAGTFALVTAMGIAGVRGAAQLSHYGRAVSLALLALFGALLSFPALAVRLSGPFTRIGNRLLALSDAGDIGSGETYLGYREATGFASAEAPKPDTVLAYSIPPRLSLNTWALSGAWNIGAEAAVSAEARTRIAYRFHARDLHLVLAPSANGKPVRFRISIDGRPPGASHGSDTTADGGGVVTTARLYQLVRQNGPVQGHTFTIEFFDTGVHAFAFPFG